MLDTQQDENEAACGGSALTAVLGVAQPVRLSTGMEDWATPQDFFDKCNAEFSFTLDACATHENAKCPAYFTKEDDGLKQSWVERSFYGVRTWDTKNTQPNS